MIIMSPTTCRSLFAVHMNEAYASLSLVRKDPSLGHVVWHILTARRPALRSELDPTSTFAVEEPSICLQNILCSRTTTSSQEDSHRPLRDPCAAATCQLVGRRTLELKTAFMSCQLYAPRPASRDALRYRQGAPAHVYICRPRRRRERREPLDPDLRPFGKKGDVDNDAYKTRPMPRALARSNNRLLLTPGPKQHRQRLPLGAVTRVKARTTPDPLSRSRCGTVRHH